MSDLALAAVLAAAILLASTISVELGLSVALIELLAGVIVGNAAHVDVPSWLSFVGTFAGIVLTFQAGAEVDVPQLRREWKASTSIGLVSFFAPFALVSVVLVVGLPWVSSHFFPRYGNRVIEPEIKLVFACLFLLMWLGSRAHSQAALPAFVLGLAMSSFYASHRMEQDRMRVVSFAFLTPFFFLKGGMNVSTSALWANLGILGVLFAAKMGPKLVGVYPLARRFTAPHATFTTLLMSTGLTFGTITSLYGLNAHIIDRTQFSLLIAVVVLSAIVPTAIAQRFYQPRSEAHRDLTAPVPPAPAPAE